LQIKRFAGITGLAVVYATKPAASVVFHHIMRRETGEST